MRISDIIQDYFTFNRKEQRGLFVLASLMTGLILADIFIDKILPKKQVDFSEFAKEVAAFEKEILLQDSLERKVNQKKYKMKYAAASGHGFDSTRQSKVPGKEPLIIELNSADTFDLQQLRGIGPSFAKRIVKYRDRLHGYYERSQILEIFGMDSAKYNEIKDHLTVNSVSIKKIDLNSVTFKELLSHPYFPFEITKNIMLYRKEHKKFRDMKELLLIKKINDSIYRKIKPYIRTD